MSDAIASVPVASRNLNQWGVSFHEYDYVNPTGGVYEGIDLETLSIKVSNRRAVVIESEVEPMAVRMNMRNTELDWLGHALADMSGFSALFTADKDGNIPTSVPSNITADGQKGLQLVGHSVGTGTVTLTKVQVDTWTQEIKTAMDSRNNASQQDMTRLQSLVDRRDEAYKTSSSLSEKVSGTRSNTIKNLV